MTQAPNENYGGTGHDGSSFTQPAPKKRNVGLIAGGALAALVLLGGGAYALTGGLNSMGDKDIAKAFPASTAYFAEVDLDPANDQKVAAVSLIEKMNTLAEKGEETEELGKSVTDEYFESLDYETEVKTWLGGKAANGSWSPAGDDKITPDVAVSVTIYEVKDKAKAQEALDKVKGDFVHGVVSGDYLVISKSKEAIDSYQSNVDTGTLDENETFESDRKLIQGNTVAKGWADFSKFDLTDLAQSYQGYANAGSGTEAKPVNIEGRFVGGITLETDAAVLSAKAIEIKSDGKVAEDVLGGAGVADFKNLPASSAMAMGIKGLDKAAIEAWEKNADAIQDNPQFSSVESQLGQYGVTLPEDFKGIFGTETSFGFGQGEETGMGGFAFQYRAVEGDETIYENIVGMSGVESMVNVAKESDVLSVEFGQPTDEAKLGETEGFNDLFKDLDKAQVVGYFDFDKIEEVRKAQNEANGGSTAENTDKKLGRVGMTASHDYDKNIGDLTVRWVY